MSDRSQTPPIRRATEEELRAQRQSWVAGEAALGSDADEAAYRAAYERGDKEEMARLDAEGDQRRQQALKRMQDDQFHKAEYERVFEERNLLHTKWEDLSETQKENIRKENMDYWKYMKDLGDAIRNGVDIKTIPFYKPKA